MIIDLVKLSQESGMMNHRVNCIPAPTSSKLSLFFVFVNRKLRIVIGGFCCWLGVGGVARLGTFLMRCLIIKTNIIRHTEPCTALKNLKSYLPYFLTNKPANTTTLLLFSLPSLMFQFLFLLLHSPAFNKIAQLLNYSPVHAILSLPSFTFLPISLSQLN